MTHSTPSARPDLMLLSGVGLLLFTSFLAGCGPAPTSGKSIETASIVGVEGGEHPPEKPSRYLGKFVYQQNCGQCHGQIGPLPPLNLDVPGKKLSVERVAALDAAQTARADERKLLPDPFYPEKLGPYDDLYDFHWFANGTEFGGFIDRNNAPLIGQTYKELFDYMSAGEHGDDVQKFNFKDSLSDRERWAVVYYISNQGLDNGLADWQYVWDQQIQLRKNVYGTHCSICHGAVGRGDGPEGHELVPKPMNFNYLDWSAGARHGYPVTDDYLFDIIANGKIHPGTIVAAHEGDDPRWTGMPFWKDQFREQDLWALVDFVRSLSYAQD